MLPSLTRVKLTGFKSLRDKHLHVSHPPCFPINLAAFESRFHVQLSDSGLRL